MTSRIPLVGFPLKTNILKTNTLKVRGIELRRHDTPPFIASLQENILVQLAKASRPELCLSQIITTIRTQLHALNVGCQGF